MTKRPVSKAKRPRLFPDNDLKAPVKRFEETFSAETVVMEAFFLDGRAHAHDGTVPERIAALAGKRIVNYTQDELTAAIESACGEFGHAQFFKMLNGIDAYMERRKRKNRWMKETRSTND